MTLSVWRYAHLLLALFSGLFLVMASVTGVILAADTVIQKTQPYCVAQFNEITLAESLPALRKKYPEITEIRVDHNGFVTLQGMDANDNDVNAYVHPLTGEILGEPQKESAFIKWVTSFHRSLFLHEAGRFFVGINAFLLLLITISGAALVIKRQKNFRRFFAKISDENFFSRYHVISGRLALLPIFILSLTGAYLSIERFHLFGEEKIEHKISEKKTKAKGEQLELAKMAVFRNVHLADVKKIEFPFTDDPDEYYTIKLKNREIVADQNSGTILSSVPYQSSTIFASLSLGLHTGRVGILWAIVLLCSCVSILFFIYSGFAITLSRRSLQIKNKYSAQESNIILLTGSENGSTIRFADAIHKQLLSAGYKSYLAQANSYQTYSKATHLIVFTATHGLGDAPANANKLLNLLNVVEQPHSIHTSVVGFGSTNYPDFCGYAKKVYTLLSKKNWAELSPLHTVNNKSVVEFTNWVRGWSERNKLPLATTPAIYNEKPTPLKHFTVLSKQSDNENTFILTLKAPFFSRFTSGDLLGIYPLNDNTERLYSIGKINNNIQLVIKLHENGVGSNFLNNLNIGDKFKARVIKNVSFHLPANKPVIMIANGTGVAPFLGMFTCGNKQYNYQLYSGFRCETNLTAYYKNMAVAEIQKHHLKGFHFAFSRQTNKMHVMDLIRRDADYFLNHLVNGGIIMLCGSIAMQQDVEKILDQILNDKKIQSLSNFKNNGQLLADCY